MTDEMPDQTDETIERIAEALRPPPQVDAEAKARVLVAVAAERARAEAESLRRRRRVRWYAGLAAGLIAALLLGRGATPGRERRADATAAVSTRIDSADAMPAAHVPDAGEAPMLPVQLVLNAPNAHRVAVVGDFTDWDEGRIAMTRDPASGLWSVTVPVRAGRHVYAFIADDSIWMRDPRAPVATDPDFGRPGSLMLVGRP